MTETRKITMEDLSIQAWTLDRLTPAENNHKKHTDESTAKLAKSLADIGQIQPVVVDKDGEIIAGHGRWMAAQKLGWDKIKVIQIPVDRATAIKARIADNLMSNQSIDSNALMREWNELLDLDEDVSLDTLIAEDGHKDLLNVVDKIEISEADLMDNALESIDAFSKEGEEKADIISTTDTPLRSVFGFSNVKPRHARVLKDFMGMVIQETGEVEPDEALVKWVSEVMNT